MLVVVDVPIAAVLLTNTTKLIDCDTLVPRDVTTALIAPPVIPKSMPDAVSPVVASVRATPGALLQTAEPGTYVKPVGKVSDNANLPAAPPVLLKLMVYVVYTQPGALGAAPATVRAQDADDERGPLVDAAGHVPPLADHATAGALMALVTLNAATVVRFTWSLSDADWLAAAYRGKDAVIGVALMVAVSNTVGVVADGGIV